MLHRAVHHIEAGLPLIQPYLEIGMLVGTVEIDGTPFDVEDTIGRSTGYRCIDAACSARKGRAAGLCISAQIVPIGEDGVIVAEPREANIRKGRVRGRELRIAIRRQIDAVEALVIERETKGEREHGYLIIPVIADIRPAWHDVAAYLNYRKICARYRRWGRRRRKRRRWAGRRCGRGRRRRHISGSLD